MDYGYAKTLPVREIDLIIEAVNEARKREEQAIKAARTKSS